jgi:hypothetical protein
MGQGWGAQFVLLKLQTAVNNVLETGLKQFRIILIRFDNNILTGFYNR